MTLTSPRTPGPPPEGRAGRLGRWPAGWPIALAVLVGVYLAGVGAVLFAPVDDPVATWWPAAGLSVSLLALAPRERWPLLVLGLVVLSGAANVTGGRDVDVSLLFGMANAAEAVVAALVLRRGRAVPMLRSQEDFVRLLVASVVGGITIATGAALSVVLVDSGGFAETWRSVVASHAASTLVLVPVALLLADRGTVSHSVAGAGPARPRRTTELVAQVGVLALVMGIVFAPGQDLPVTFAPLPFLVWAALRFGLRLVVVELTVISVLTTSLSAHGYGPFGASLSHAQLDAVAAGALAQGFLFCAALTAVPLAIASDQRERMLSLVVASERLFRGNFTESLVGMLLLRVREGRLVVSDLNDTARGLFSDTPGSPVGRPLDSVLETDGSLAPAVAAMLAGGRDGWKARTGLRHRPDAQVDVSLSLVAAKPEPVFAAQLLDVTTEHRALRRLRELDSAKDELVSTVSHELRTPLASIVGYVEMLQEGVVVDPLPEQRRMLETIDRNARRLIVICNDLLLLGGLDAAADPDPAADRAEHGVVDLSALGPRVEEALGPLLAGRHLEVELGWPDRPVVVRGDRSQLERVLLNLLGNAVKFTEDGGGVRCRLERTEDEAVLTVSDTGIGVPAEEQHGLFQRFFRSSTAQARAIPGTGLGLSIVASVVDAHRGSISVDSAHLQGTTFTVRLPLAAASVARRG